MKNLTEENTKIKEKIEEKYSKVDPTINKIILPKKKHFKFQVLSLDPFFQAEIHKLQDKKINQSNTSTTNVNSISMKEKESQLCGMISKAYPFLFD